MPAQQLLSLTGGSLPQPVDFMRPGMPAVDSVHAASTFTPVPGGATYQVLHTTELDSYEPVAAAVSQLLQQPTPPSPDAVAGLLAAVAAPAGDNFAGTARSAAKLSIPR